MRGAWAWDMRNLLGICSQVEAISSGTKLESKTFFFFFCSCPCLLTLELERMVFLRDFCHRTCMLQWTDQHELWTSKSQRCQAWRAATREPKHRGRVWKSRGDQYWMGWVMGGRGRTEKGRSHQKGGGRTRHNVLSRTAQVSPWHRASAVYSFSFIQLTHIY